MSAIPMTCAHCGLTLLGPCEWHGGLPYHVHCAQPHYQTPACPECVQLQQQCATSAARIAELEAQNAKLQAVVDAARAFYEAVYSGDVELLVTADVNLSVALAALEAK